MAKQQNAHPIGFLLSVLLAGVVFASVWVPELSHWYVRPDPIASTVLQESRRAPRRDVLDEIGAMRLSPMLIEREQVVPTAESVMRGTLQLSGFPAARITLPFSGDDLVRTPTAWQLLVASLAGADILLDAYAMAGREDFFESARDTIIAFAQYEAKQWVDHGLMWNDHAIAARIPVLAKFWARYRDRPDFDPAVGQLVLTLVSRSGRLLSEPSNYTWRTGHGVIQNLALLQISAAFPSLPDSPRLKAVALERFQAQINYHIAREGVTLLHSAGYHFTGVYFFGMALRLWALNSIEPPANWWVRYGKAKDFYALLRRPNGSLPMYGDTWGASYGQGPPITTQGIGGGAEPMALPDAWRPKEAWGLFPVAGHAVWWERLPNDASTQTVVTWSHHPGHGHKLADELSVLLWGYGRTWLTNVGYWPYGTEQRRRVEQSWEGSNAPHLLEDTAKSARTSRVERVGRGEKLTFIEVVRSGPGEYSVRRQIAQVDGRIWLVIDHSEDTMPRTTTTAWTFYPDLTVSRDAASGAFRISGASSPATMFASFSGQDDSGIELVRGSEKSPSGWVVMDRTPVSATSIIVRQPSQDSWRLATFTLLENAGAVDFRGAARMSRWLGHREWAVVVPTSATKLVIERKNNQVTVADAGSGVRTVVDLDAIDVRQGDIDEIRTAFRAAETRFHTYVPLFPYRVRITYVLLAVLALQEIAFFVLRRRSSGLVRGLRAMSWVIWAAGGIWLYAVYFRVT